MKDQGSQDVRQLRIDELLLDWQNPRLPAEMQSPERSQRQLAEYINKHYDPLRIAESIANHRYFESEPLIAVPNGDLFTVIEGNRRLTALKGLGDPELRETFAIENSRWRALPQAVLPERIPVLVVENAEDVAPLLGYRHISGIEPWEPFAQARYIAGLVDGGKTLEEVSELVGRDSTEVKSMYRDYDILRQGSDEFGLDVSRAKKAFGVFNNAMGRTAIRAYIEAPAPRLVDVDVFPIPENRAANLRNLLHVMFGGPRGDGRVIKDSRQLGSLAKILADPTGRAFEVLRATANLEEALDAATDPVDQFDRSVKAALTQLEKASRLQPSEVSPVSRDALRKVAKISRLLVGRFDQEAAK